MVQPGWEGARTLVLVERRPEAERVSSLWLADPQGARLPPFVPGQYLTLEVPAPGRAPLVRCYSLSAPVGPEGGARYRLTVKAEGAASRWLVEEAPLGAALEVRAPGGRFVLDPGAGPLVLIAGGIGVTPLACMATALAAQGMPRETWLLLAARRRRELALEGELRALAEAHPRLRLEVILSRPDPGDRCDHEGRVDASLLARLLPPSDAPYGFYLCGPPAMTADLTRGLLELGVPRSAIHEELFGPATVRRLRDTARLTPGLLPAPPAAATPSGTLVRFARSGQEATWTPAAGTLLELAEGARVPIPSACLAGRCGTCLTRVLEGKVRHLVEPSFTALPPDGCLTCIAAPDGPLTLDA